MTSSVEAVALRLLTLTLLPNLSGGQKQRVALARACYANADLALLDDVFSALDANTAVKVFDGLFGHNSQGVLSSRGSLLVTHAEQFLPRVDKVLVMVDGEPSFFGSYNELHELVEKSESAANLIDLSSKEDHAARDKRRVAKLRKDGANEDDGIIMTVEERNYGVSSFVDWATWFINAGGVPFIVFQLVFLVLDRGLFVLSDWWLSQWADSAYKELDLWFITIPPQIDGRDAQTKYVGIYCIIVFLSVVATSFRSQWMCESIAEVFGFFYFVSLTHLYMFQSREALDAPKSCFRSWPSGYFERLYLTLRRLH